MTDHRRATPRLLIGLTASVILIAGCTADASQSAVGSSLTSAVALARDLARTLPLKQVRDLGADSGSLIGADGSTEPEVAISRSSLTNGDGSFASFDPVSEGIWIDQDSSIAAAVTEWSWISSSGSNYSASPAYCDNVVFYGDWLDETDAPDELARGLKAVGVTCSQAEGLGQISTSTAAQPMPTAATQIPESGSSTVVSHPSPSSSSTSVAQLFPVTDSNLQLFGIGSNGAPAWSIPEYATSAQKRALAKIYTSGPLMVRITSMDILSGIDPGPPTTEDELMLHIKWTSAMGPGGSSCYAFILNLSTNGRVVFKSSQLPGQTMLTTVTQLKDSALSARAEWESTTSLPLHAATWITHWTSMSITYNIDMAC